MEKFNLEKYLANPSRKVVTREGRSARIICTDAKEGYPVVALIALEGKHGGYEKPETYTKDGRCYSLVQTDLDLFFTPEKHEGWTNVYRGLVSGELYCANVYEREEFAKKAGEGSIATVKIEWEE